MTALDDHELLAQYARTESEPAFATLVARHVNLVYSAALRFTGNPLHAEEITQAVFIILARKAGKLSSRVVLSGWLYQVARLTAANLVKGEIRRRQREQEAYMQSTLTEPDPAWVQIAPLLDEAMSQLGETDRAAVVLRFFENKTAVEVEAALQLTEAAAHKRTARALEKLRKFFTKRGAALSSVAIAGAISANSVQAAPVGLAKAVTAVAIVKGSIATASTLTLVKGALNIMAWTKMKTAIVFSLGMLLVAEAAEVTVKQIEGNDSWRSILHFYSQSAMLADLDKTPPQVTILPTIHPDWGAMWWSDKAGRRLGMNSSVTNLLFYAYGELPSRMIFSEAAPAGKYDFMANLPQGSAEAFRQKIKEQFGLVAHIANVNADVWILKIGDKEKAKTITSKKARPHSEIDWVKGSSTIEDKPVSELADALEGWFLHAPVLDQTGFFERYDFALQWNVQDKSTRTRMIVDQLHQVGLELVPANLPTEMLVVEKVK